MQAVAYFNVTAFQKTDHTVWLPSVHTAGTQAAGISSLIGSAVALPINMTLYYGLISNQKTTTGKKLRYNPYSALSNLITVHFRQFHKPLRIRYAGLQKYFCLISMEFLYQLCNSNCKHINRLVLQLINFVNHFVPGFSAASTTAAASAISLYRPRKKLPPCKRYFASQSPRLRLTFLIPLVLLAGIFLSV